VIDACIDAIPATKFLNPPDPNPLASSASKPSGVDNDFPQNDRSVDDAIVPDTL